ENLKQTVFVAANGNVGISTRTPRATFDCIGGAVASGLYVASPDADLSTSTYWGALPNVQEPGDMVIGQRLGTALIPERSLYMGVGGALGVGTWNPMAKLDVRGKIRTCLLTVENSCDLEASVSVDVIGGMRARTLQLTGGADPTLDVTGTARMTVCQITSDRNAKKNFV